MNSYFSYKEFFLIQTIRKSPTSSEHSTRISYKNQDWEIGDAESIYQQRGKISPERKVMNTNFIHINWHSHH